MGDYAASVKMSTKIDITDVKKLENSFAKVAERAAIAKDKVDALDRAGTSHNADTYKTAVSELEKWTKALEKFSNRKKEASLSLPKTAGSFSSLSDEVEDYESRLKQLRDQGFGAGDEIYDNLYVTWKNVVDVEKEYLANLNKKTDKGIAAEAERLAKAKEKEAEQQRKIEEMAERNLQKENARLEKETQIQSRIHDQEAEQQRLNAIQQEAVVSDERLVLLLEEQEKLQARLNDLKKAGVTAGYEEHDFITGRLQEISGEIDHHMGKTQSKFRSIADVAKKAFSSAASVIKKGINGVTGLFHKIGQAAGKVFGRMHKDTGKQNSLLGIMKSRLGGIALSLLVFNWISKGFNAMIAGMKEGLQNLAQYSKDYNAVMSDMVSALATLKNAFATAFAPIATVAIPYITQLINYLTMAVNRVAQLIAALTGKTTWTKAKDQAIDYAKSLNMVSKSAKEAYRSLASFDELNVLNKNEISESGLGLNPSDMFEEVPITPQIKELADKFKNVLSKVFEPLKKAWDRQGKKVMDAWKYALKEASKLVKSIASDFLEVWTQETSVKIFEDILLIIADIGLIVGNLSEKFKEAWEANEIGKKILENIRDIIGAIIKNIREAADLTVEWSDNLDFTFLLEAFQRFTSSFAKAADFLSGVLADFYTQVLLPLGKWVIEKGLPDLLDIFTKFNNQVDWEKLRTRLSQFWEHLEPFAETIGEGLIIFIERLSEKLADFLGSETFDNFLNKIEEWMDSVEPEDVADGLESIAKAIVGMQVALLLFNAISTVVPILDTIMLFLIFFKGGGGAAAAGGMTAAAGGISKLSAALVALAEVGAGIAIIEMLVDPLIRLGEAAGMGTQQSDYLMDRYKNLGWLKAPADAFSILTNGIQGLGWEMSNALGTSAAFESAMDNIAKGTIYTDEQLEKMRKNYGFTEEDIESLRQEMLEANPALRELADGFGLFDASAETLKNVSDGMMLIEDKTFDSADALEQYAKKAGYTSEAIGILTDQIQEGLGKSIEDFKIGVEASGQSIEDFKENITTVGQSVKDLEEDFTSAGSNTAAGFIQGFESGAEQADSTADTFCEKFIAKIKSLFGIHSPSTVMAEIGKFLISGLIKGIGDKASDLKESLTKVYDTVKGVLDKLKSFVNDMVSSMKEKISSITSGISSTWKSVTGGVSGIFGRSASNTAYAYEIPALATGGITTGTTIAKIGEAGREAVLPLENNTGWMDALAEKLWGNGSITFVAQMDSGVIFSETVSMNEMFKKQNGHSALG